MSTSKYDRCPTCRGPLAFLGTRKRACLGECPGGRTWILRGTVRQWRARLADREEPTVPLRGRAK